jgi:protein involved in polysaccharide export with SLBB domain
MKETLDLEKLLQMAGGVMPVGYLQRVQVERVRAHEKKIVVDLNLSTTGPQSGEQWQTPLQDGDTVKIYPVLSLTEEIVYLEGHVKRPGGYEAKEGMKISDLIKSFDDLRPEPHLEYAEIIRLEEPDLHERVISFNLGEALKKKSEQDLKLQNLDRIKIFSKTDFEDKYNVTIIGQVRRPESYKLFEGMTVKDLVEKAGGFLDNAYLQKAELTRRIIEEGKTVSSRQLNINIQQAMAGDDKDNVLLQKYDTLKIQIIPEWETMGLAIIEGEVQFPGEYPLKRGEKLSSLIKRAGGYTGHAYLRGAVFTRESAKETHQKRIDELISKMEVDIQSTTAMVAGGALDKEDIAAAQQALASQQELLKKLRTAEITGRVVINLKPLEEFAASKFDVELEDEDKLVIPYKPGIVEVLGEVYNPTAVLYEEGQTIGHYLDKVGGPTQNAEEDEIYLVKADGSVISRSQEGLLGLSWDAENNRWTTGGFLATKVRQGDVVLVPRRLKKIPWLKNTADIVQIIFQTAVATGVLIAIF